MRRSQEREREKAGCIDIFRIGRVELFHRQGVAPVTVVLVTLAIQDLDCMQVSLLARRSRLGAASFGRRAELREGAAGGGKILLLPDRVVVRHRLAPVSHYEIWVERL